jgi:S-adenosylmethionine/arginine decarboxylase-like enzyme
VTKLLEHKHLVIRAEINNPPQCTTSIELWMKTLVKKIGMKVLMGPFSTYSDMVGNRGLTAVTIIETSHIALHVWDEVHPALCELDVYTCSSLDINDVFEMLQVFEPNKIEYQYIDREHGLVVLDMGTISLEKE